MRNVSPVQKGKCNGAEKLKWNVSKCNNERLFEDRDTNNSKQTAVGLKKGPELKR